MTDRPHIPQCRKAPLDHTDEAKRVADAVNKHTQDGSGISWVWENVQGKFMAFSLNDGQSNGDLYDTQPDAVKHTDPYKSFYVRIQAAYMSDCEAEIMLAFHRKARARGFPQADPDNRTPGIIPRIGTQEVRQQIRGLN